MTSIPPSLVATCSPFHQQVEASDGEQGLWATDRKSTRLNSSHGYISYAVFCLKKKTRQTHQPINAIPITNTLTITTPSLRSPLPRHTRWDTLGLRRSLSLPPCTLLRRVYRRHG